jgi:hypothetical protein
MTEHPKPSSQSPSARAGLLVLVLYYLLRMYRTVFLSSDLKILSSSLRLQTLVKETKASLYTFNQSRAVFVVKGEVVPALN